MKTISTIYSCLVGILVFWAWQTYFINQGSSQEHMLPEILLMLVTLPSSLLFERAAQQIPLVIDSPVFQLTLMTGLAVIQAILVQAIFFFARRKLPKA